MRRAATSAPRTLEGHWIMRRTARFDLCVAYTLMDDAENA